MTVGGEAPEPSQQILERLENDTRADGCHLFESKVWIKWARRFLRVQKTGFSPGRLPYRVYHNSSIKRRVMLTARPGLLRSPVRV